jgi:hypothetical protein
MRYSASWFGIEIFNLRLVDSPTMHTVPRGTINSLLAHLGLLNALEIG